MNFTTVDDVLWLAGFVGHVGLLAVLVRWERWREFPIFTALIAYETTETTILFIVSRFGTAREYFLWYWILALFDYIFQICLLVEIARAVFPRSAQWIYRLRGGFVLLSVLGVLGAAVLCMMMAPPDVHGLDLWDERVTLFTSLLTCELYFALSARANRWRLQWKGHVMSIGQGLAIWASTAVMGDIAHALVGWERHFVFPDRLRMFVYLGDLAYWTWALHKPEQTFFSSIATIRRVFARHSTDNEERL